MHDKSLLTNKTHIHQAHFPAVYQHIPDCQSFSTSCVFAAGNHNGCLRACLQQHTEGVSYVDQRQARPGASYQVNNLADTRAR